MYRRSFWQILITCALLVSVQGCATTDRRVNLLYQPTANVKGGSGTVYLVQGVRSASRQAAGIQWILGSITKSSGEKSGNVVTDTAPANLAMDALKQELKSAGYNIVQSEAMPAGARKGVLLHEVSLKLDEKSGVVSDEANCSVRMSLQPWRNGKPVDRLSYEAEYSETAVTDRDLLLSKTLQTALQLVMKRSVPEVVNVLEKH